MKFSINLLSILFLFSNGFTYSQSSDSTQLKHFGGNNEKWEIAIPIWIPGFKGGFSYGDVSLEGEDGETPEFPPIENPIAPPEDGGGNIFSRLFNREGFLRFFYMGKIAYKPDPFVIQFDFFGGDAGANVNFKYNNKEIINSTYDLFIMHLTFGWMAYQYRNVQKYRRLIITPFVGVRYVSTSFVSDLTFTNRKLDLRPKWTEVIWGIKTEYIISRWKILVKGDLGTSVINPAGFSYRIQLLGHYSLTSTTAIRFGWTDLDLKYDGDYFNEPLIINTHLSGPNLGVTFFF